MSDSNNEVAAGGLSCTGLLAVGLTILFVALKLLDKIDWSWWWVLSPLWIYVGLGVLVVVLILAVVVVIAIIAALWSRRSNNA